MAITETTANAVFTSMTTEHSRSRRELPDINKTERTIVSRWFAWLGGFRKVVYSWFSQRFVPDLSESLPDIPSPLPEVPDPPPDLLEPLPDIPAPLSEVADPPWDPGIFSFFWFCRPKISFQEIS